MSVDFSCLESTQRFQWDGVEILLVNRAECKASIALLGGQLLSFEPEGDLPVLWQNPSADFSGNTAIRSGIPICWPWFNAITMNPTEVQDSFDNVEHPSHGPVRSQQWILLSVVENAHDTKVCLQADYSEKELSLRVTYTLGTTLSMEVEAINNSPNSIAFCAALHSYFAISDIGSVAVNGFDQCRYSDMIDEGQDKTQQGYIMVEEEVDRLYFNGSNPIRLLDEGWARQLEISCAESSSTVVWNPWVDKAQRTSQMLPDDYQKFICIETGRVGEDFVQLPAGESFRLQLNIASKLYGKIKEA